MWLGLNRAVVEWDCGFIGLGLNGAVAEWGCEGHEPRERYEAGSGYEAAAKF